MKLIITIDCLKAFTAQFLGFFLETKKKLAAPYVSIAETVLRV
jgi:hypothetical protein